MVITKGFLNRKYDFQPSNLSVGLILWVFSGYIFYAFFQLYREIFRFFTGHIGDGLLLVLTPHENFIYNLFYAAMASAFGFSVALRFVIQLSMTNHDRRTKSLLRRTLNIEGFNSWSFLQWFGRLGSIMGIWYSVFSMQYELDIIKEFPLLFILLPLVLLYGTWPSFSRLIRTKKMLWFLSLTGLFLTMSFAFSLKNFTDYKTINMNELKHSIHHTFNLKVPASQSQESINGRSFAIDFYIVRDTIATDVPIIFWDNINTRLNLQDLHKTIDAEKKKVFRLGRDRQIANLHIDGQVLMKYVYPIIDELRKSSLTKIQFSTSRKYSRYPSEYPPFKYIGIQSVLPKYYPNLVKFLDSAERIDLTGKTFKISESMMYRNASIKGYNRIEITATQESARLNGQIMDPLHLEQRIYEFIKKYSPNYVVIFNSNDEITYKRYIEILDLLWTPVDRLRNDFSLDRYNQPFDNWYWGTELNTIKSRYPRNIVEWTTEEKRLNELIKKASKVNS